MDVEVPLLDVEFLDVEDVLLNMEVLLPDVEFLLDVDDMLVEPALSVVLPKRFEVLHVVKEVIVALEPKWLLEGKKERSTGWVMRQSTSWSMAGSTWWCGR